jgi:lysophospholipase L1-like esterase
MGRKMRQPPRQCCKPFATAIRIPIAITPITSSKEVQDPSYSQRSIHTRAVMREPVQELIEAGDRRLFLVEGEDLIGFKEHDLLSKDGVHPSDQGYGVIAARIAPVIKRALGL